MSPEEKDEFKDVVREVVKESLEETMKSYYVEREGHYLDHVFVRDVRNIFSLVKSNTVKTIVLVLITGGVGAILTGLLFWVKSHLK